jgi:hypothetical protein
MSNFYPFDTKATSMWIFPDGNEVSKPGIYEHDNLLENIEGFDYADDPYESNHGPAFEAGYLRVSLITETGELNLQWACLLSAAQRRRATELAEGCNHIEIASACEGYDPQGDTLRVEDPTFRRQFASQLRIEHSEWDEL